MRPPRVGVEGGRRGWVPTLGGSCSRTGMHQRWREADLKAQVTREGDGAMCVSADTSLPFEEAATLIAICVRVCFKRRCMTSSPFCALHT